MESRYSFWLMSTCASVLLFVGQRLETLGNVIACEVERPYGGSAGDMLSFERKRLKAAGRQWFPEKSPITKG
jgi:hypothetical protein